jgi:hypothetical protein
MLPGYYCRILSACGGRAAAAAGRRRRRARVGAAAAAQPARIEPFAPGERLFSESLAGRAWPLS